MATDCVDGLVLRKINYSETSIIIRVLTSENTLKSFMFQGAKRKNKRGNIISSLSPIQISYYQRSDSDLAKISTVEPTYIFKTIPFDPYKSSVVFFMNELLNNTLKEDDTHTELYAFIYHILQVLDLSDHIANFPIKFLYRLTKYLGFYPEMNDRARYFDLRECCLTPYRPNHPDFLGEELTALLLQLIESDFDGKNDPPISLHMRRGLLNGLLKYYQIIFDDFKPLMSLPVLESTFHD